MTEAPTCERCESPIETGDLRCALCGQAVPVQTVQRDAVEVTILRCGGCGASLSYSAEAQGLRCGFCDSVLHLERIEDPLERVEQFLPFLVDRETARGGGSTS